MTIAKVMEGKHHDITSCRHTATVEEAARLLAARRIGALPIMIDDRIAGIFSERDLLYCVASQGAAVLSKRVEEVMTAPAITVDADTEVLEALSLMTRRRIRHLPVEKHGNMIGFISIGDLVKYRIECVESEAEQMREYIQTA